MTIQKKIENKILEYFNAYGESLISFENEDGNGIVLDTCVEGENLEVYNVNYTLMADTNFGCVNLKDYITDEDDWLTIEDVVNDIVDSILKNAKMENSPEGFQK